LSSLTTGSTLCEGRYRLDGVVGRGGMAIVWRATDLQLERDVAIKVISDVLADDPRFVARFEREARLAAGLSHPNLVKVFDFSVVGERPFLVMEYVPGGTLAQARGRELDVVSVARDLLDAMAHIHAAGILHRDIKPGNVLLGEDDSPRLTDFGIARGEDTTSLTQTGQVLGTLRYIAPEVAAGEPATPQSDLFALGVLLGELSTDPPEELARLVRRLTARDPAGRPRSAADALAELDPTRILPATEPLPPTVALPTDLSDGVHSPRPIDSPRGIESPRAIDSPGGIESPRGTDWPRRIESPRRIDSPASAGARRAPGGFVLRRSHAIAAAAALLAVLALVIVAASGGGGGSKLDVTRTTTSLQPAPAGAPVDQQLDRLEQIVRSAPRKP
jgi:serine/threonine protein kinase